MSWDDVIQCMACPGVSFTDREVYAAHVKTKWHLYNTNCRMMGNATLSHEAYVEKFGDPTAVGSVANDLSNPSEKKAEEKQAEAKKEEEAKVEEPVENDTVTVVVMFTYHEEKWSHKFSVKKGSTIWDLKQSMVKPESPEEDVVSFSLKTGMIRAWNFETIESDETYDFQYIGPEEGQKFLDRDKLRKQRDDEEARARLEEEERKKEEKTREEEERRREAEERDLQERRKQEEEEEKRRQEEEKAKRRKEEEEAERLREEEEARRRHEEEEEARRKEEEEAERRRQEEEEARRKEEEEAERRRQEEEEEARRKEEEEAERRRLEEEARREQEAAEAERRRLEEEEEARRQEQLRLEQESQAEERRQAELQAQASEPVEVTVHIDRALDFKTTVTLRRGARVREVKERLAEDDPTGQLRPEDLGLCDSTQRELGDDEQVMQTTEFDLKSTIA